MWTDAEWALVGWPVSKRAMTEVLADIAAGTVPPTVTCFVDLHDHVDANGYGGAFESWEEGACGDDEHVAFWNRVQGDVDQWLKAGRPLCPACGEPWNRARIPPPMVPLDIRCACCCQ